MGLILSYFQYYTIENRVHITTKAAKINLQQRHLYLHLSIKFTTPPDLLQHGQVSSLLLQFLDHVC